MTWDWWEVANGVFTILIYVGLMRMLGYRMTKVRGKHEVVAARAEGYARGLIEGDHGGRREGYRSGYAAGKDAVMTASYAQAVAEGQRDEREACAAYIAARGLPITAAAIRAREEKP